MGVRFFAPIFRVLQPPLEERTVSGGNPIADRSSGFEGKSEDPGENASGRSHFQKGFCQRNVNCDWKMI